MSTPPKPRKHKHKETSSTMAKHHQETVAQVHKASLRPPVERSTIISGGAEEQPSDNNGPATPSREMSVDDDSQINSKIISLIETEMKRDANKHSHFTDSRPQSLSFYEDEKLPDEEELSGNLELLSPEERKHYKRIITDDEMNAYNVIQDLYGGSAGTDGDNEIISSSKKSKSRKKRHEQSTTELGMGDSREMMIPKEKRKSKRKKRESSPLNGKKKHRRRDAGDGGGGEHGGGGGGEPRSDVTVVLEELQDDVFDNTCFERDLAPPRPEKPRRSPRKSDKLYVQKKNKFEARVTNLNRQGAYDFEEDVPGKKFLTYHPLELALPFQEYWMRFSTLCHGLLGGLAFGHWLYVISNIYVQDEDFISHYSHFSDTYVSLFYMLCVICLISVFEKVDFAHYDGTQLRDLFRLRRSSIVILVYFACLVIHLSAARIDYKLGLVSYNNETISNITESELTEWNHLSFWRSMLAFVAWFIVGLSPQDNMFYSHLKSMEKYLPQK